MNKVLFNQRGITLVELMVSILVASIVSLAIYRMFDTQNKLFAGEQKVVSMHGNERNAMDTLSRNLRLIGYDPGEKGADTFGLTDSGFSAGSTAAIVSSSEIYFTADLDEDGEAANPPVGGTRSSAREFIAFRLNGSNLEQANITDAIGTIGSWRVVVEGVTALEFVYSYTDGTNSTVVGLPTNAVSARNFEKVESIDINTSFRTDTVHNLTRQYSVETITTRVSLRNNL